MFVRSNKHAKCVVSAKVQTVVSTNSNPWVSDGRKSFVVAGEDTTNHSTSVKQNLLVSELVHEGGSRATNTVFKF